MLAKFMDTAALKRACGLDTTEYTNAATLGLLPRACGTFNGIPLWFDSDVRTFAQSVGKAFDENWSEINVTLASHITKASPELQREAQAAASDEWPEEMHQSMACEYLDTNSQVFSKAIKQGLLNHTREGRLIVFRKADLDAFRELPFFARRIRHTKKKSAATVVTRVADLQKPAMAKPETLLTEKGAADFLGIHYGALSLSRKYGTGPQVAIDSSGAARYRLCDLQEFADRHLSNHDRTDARTRTDVVKQTKPDGTRVAVTKGVGKANGALIAPQVVPVEPQADTAPVQASGAPVLDRLLKLEDATLLTLGEIADYLGVHKKTVENWRTHRKFLEPAKFSDSSGHPRPLFRADAVRAWVRTNQDSVIRAREGKGHFQPKPTGTMKNGARPGAKKVLKATSARRQPTRTSTTRQTLGGARVRH